jgi:hypothetical protein
LLPAVSFWRPVCGASVIALTFWCLASGSGTVRADDFIAPDAALTQRLASFEATATAPPVLPADFHAWLTERDRAPLDGKLVWRTPRSEAPARGTRVFLMPEGDYSAWFAKAATDDALANKDGAAALDDKARSTLVSAIADRNGVFSFPSVPEGPYVLFAVLNVTIGPATPAEHVERGWDGNGRGADVIVPSVEIPQSHLESFRYLYAYMLRKEQRPWHLGVVRPNTQVHDGQPATLR